MSKASCIFPRLLCPEFKQLEVAPNQGLPLLYWIESGAINTPNSACKNQIMLMNEKLGMTPFIPLKSLLLICTFGQQRCCSSRS